LYAIRAHALHLTTRSLKNVIGRLKLVVIIQIYS